MTEPTANPKAAMFAAIAELQADLPRIAKGETAQVRSDKGNYSYKYADLADVAAEVMPRLAKFGLGFIARPTLNGDGKFVLAYSLTHKSGEREDGEYPLTAGASPQATGSAITYARRYTLCAVTGTTPHGDDDGKAAEDGWRHSAGQPSDAAGVGGGQVTRARVPAQAAGPRRPAPDLIGDWQVSIDSLKTRDDADKLLADLRGQYSARTVKPATATAVSDAIRAKAATLPGLEVPA